MRLTNTQNLPAPLVAAIERHEHRGADYTASGLKRSPRQMWLAKRHADEIVKDVSGMVWAMFGTAFHAYVSKYDTDKTLSEEYLEIEVLGKKLSGTFDLYDSHEKKLWDFKTCSVWSVIYQSSLADWTAQANVYAYLLRNHGFTVEKLSVLALMRDWQESKASDQGYPPTQAQEVKLECWTEKACREYIAERIALLESHRDTPDDELPHCTPIERWEKPAVYAVMKDGRKSAVKLHNNEADATEHATMLGCHVVKRPGEWNRCARYCDAANFCNQWKAHCAELGDE